MMPNFARRIWKITGMTALLAIAVGVSACSCSAQVVQQPTLRSFNLNSAVAVPDGGTIRLGGINRSQSGTVSRGVPGFSGIPGLSRGFRNRAIGRSTGSSQATAKVDLIIMSELEAQVLAEGRRLQAIRQQSDPNGSQAVQRRADFISRNIGR